MLLVYSEHGKSSGREQGNRVSRVSCNRVPIRQDTHLCEEVLIGGSSEGGVESKRYFQLPKLCCVGVLFYGAPQYEEHTQKMVLEVVLELMVGLHHGIQSKA